MKTIWTKLIGTLLLMATTSQGAWAQATVSVSDKGALRTEVNKDNITVTLGDDITLDTGDLYEDGRLDVRGVNVTLDLNGHKLRRVLEEANAEGQVIFLKNGAKLTIIDSSADNSGQITGGWSHQGGAIYVEEGGELTISGGTITGNRADQISGGGYGFGGAIENHGTVTITGGIITGNTAGTYGGAICTEGILTLDGVTITGNTAQKGGGIYMFKSATSPGIVQLKGETTITGNSARTGGGILQVTNGAGAAGPTLKMEGKPVVQGNTTSDVYLQSYQLITVSGAFSKGARIGVCTEVEQNAFTASFSQFNPAVAPSTVFFVSSPVIAGDVVWNDDQYEARIQKTGYAYVERAWDEENKKVTETIKTCTSFTEINGNSTGDNGWLPLNNNEYGGWYVVTGNSSYDALIVQGTDVHLIIPDGVTLNVKHVKLETGYKLTIYSQCEDSGTLDASNDEFDNAAGIGGGNGASCGTLIIHGGVVQAQGDENGAGIGSGKESPDMAGYITIYGGTVWAKGGEDGAGIGGGRKANGAILHIYGGTIEANSTCEAGDNGDFHGKAAGIGGGWNGHGVETHIHGGTVTAKGVREAAGIGGGYGGNGGLIEISGGNVIAHKSWDLGAAIGCGYYGESATIVISGGMVDAEIESFNQAACIGGGGDDDNPVLNITISGGTVIADGYGAQGIGPGGEYNFIGLFEENGLEGNITITGGIIFARGYERAIGGSNFEECLTRVSIPDNAMVMAGNSPNDAAFVEAGLRLSAVLSHNYIYMEKCIHSGSTITIDNGLTHHITCNFCIANPEGQAEIHTFAADGSCICGLMALSDTADNTSLLSSWDEQTVPVTLAGRTLWKDGTWNTLCLPFALDDEDTDDELTFTGTPLEGATVKTLETTAFADGVLTLNFSTDGLTAIEAGRPYIVRWDKPATYVAYDGTNAATCSDLVNPIFRGVTLSAAAPAAVETDEVTFSGLYAPFAISGENRSLLYLGSGNTLYYPDAAMTIGACRAFFLLADGITAGNPSPSGETEGSSIRSFVLNFGDDTSGITEAEANASFQEWFSLDGRRLSGKPAQKGLYLHNGRKVMVK